MTIEAQLREAAEQTNRIAEMVMDYYARTGSMISFDHEANSGSTPVTVTRSDGTTCTVNFGVSVFDDPKAWEMFFLHVEHELDSGIG